MNKNIELARTASSWVGRRITVFYLDAEGQSFPSGMGATITQDDDEMQRRTNSSSPAERSAF